MLLVIYAVDGETVYSLDSSSPQELLKFLRQYDHEGSSVSLDTGKEEESNSEMVYRILESL